MKPVICRFALIYGIHWDIYHMLLVKLRNSIPRNFWTIDVEQNDYLHM